VQRALINGILAPMSYRTKRPVTRSLLVFGVGATLAIAQLGAGCVPVSARSACDDAGADDSGRCVNTPAGNGSNEGGDAK
jgi:hypothetical protein